MTIELLDDHAELVAHIAEKQIQSEDENCRHGYER